MLPMRNTFSQRKFKFVHKWYRGRHYTWIDLYLDSSVLKVRSRLDCGYNVKPLIKYLLIYLFRFWWSLTKCSRPLTHCIIVSAYPRTVHKYRYRLHRVLSIHRVINYHVYYVRRALTQKHQQRIGAGGRARIIAVYSTR